MRALRCSACASHAFAWRGTPPSSRNTLLAPPRPPTGDVVASTGVEKDRQLIVWHPASGAQLARTRLDEDYQALHFLDDRTLCAVNAEALTVRGATLGWVCG